MNELQASIHETLESLNANGGDISNAMAVARVKARIFAVYARTLKIQLDHAARTNRLVQGSDVLPDVTLAPPTPAKPRRVA